MSTPVSPTPATPTPAPSANRTRPSRRALVILILVALAATAVAWWWFAGKSEPETKAGKGAAPPVSVTTAVVTQADLPVTVVANGSVVPLQSVEIRPQVASTVRTIHIAEGQTVARGDLLFTLDARTEDANVRKSEAQVVKTRSDVANAERNLKRQRELFEQKFISQAALDTAINQVDVFRGQLAVDEAAVEGTRVARSLTEIRAPFSGRTGAIAVRTGSLVQPNTQALVTISQIDPIAVSFALPERELSYVQGAMGKGDVPVSLELTAPNKQTLKGKLTFIESTVDSASGTIAMKAAFSNPQKLLWPGMFVNVSMATRVIPGASVVPVQAVQSGPERKFVYVVGEGNKASMRPVDVEIIQGGMAAIKGVPVGTKVVLEGAQNVRKDSIVAEGAAREGVARDGKGKGGSTATAAGEKGAGAVSPTRDVPSAASK